MKKLLLLLLALPAMGYAQTARDLTEIGIELNQKANSPREIERLIKEAAVSPESYVVEELLPGTLYYTSGTKPKSVAGLRYNVGLHFVQIRDSLGLTVNQLDNYTGFDLGRGAQARRFRDIPVRVGEERHDFVEVLTAGDKPPLVLAVQYYFINEPAEMHPILHTQIKPARRLLGQRILAGAGTTAAPLRELNLNQKPVLKLFGTKAPAVQTYAASKTWRYDSLGDVLKMIDYYNTL